MPVAATTPLDRLCRSHEVFHRLREKNGAPPVWRRPATFATLALLVLEQQVSLASARSAFLKLERAIDEVEPEPFLELSDETLRQIGFSRQKASYTRGIAELMATGALDLVAVSRLEADAAIAELVTIRGIGRWTASCFALFVNGAEDIWPSGDRALAVSMAAVLRLDDVPSTEEADAIAAAWAPYRSIAAAMLWHEYLGGAEYRRSEHDGFLDGTGMVLG